MPIPPQPAERSEDRDHLAELEALWAREDAELDHQPELQAPGDAPATVQRIADLDPDDRPRERLLRHGADALANYELLAILLSSGRQGENVLEVSRRLLKERGLVGLLRSDVRELMDISGLGEAKVTRIKAAVQLASRGLADDEWSTREPLQTAEQVFKRYQPLLADLPREDVWVLVLDRQNYLIREERIYQGMVDGAAVRIAELLRPVILHQGRAMILVHNHPSGSPVPSHADQQITAELALAAQTMAIDLLDHIIVVRDSFESMLKMGVLTSDAADRAQKSTSRRSRRSASRRPPSRRRSARSADDA